jgi:hypothetical protein
MLRKTLIGAALAVCGLVGWAGFTGLARTADQAEKPGASKSAPLVHAVIFHLKQDAPEGEADALIADAHDMLRSIPSVRDLKAGKPAQKPKPDRAKTDYQVGLLVLFDDLEGLDAYIKHPQHLKYVEKHGKFIDFEKIGVYDFIDQKKQ